MFCGVNHRLFHSGTRLVVVLYNAVRRNHRNDGIGVAFENSVGRVNGTRRRLPADRLKKHVFFLQIRKNLLYKRFVFFQGCNKNILLRDKTQTPVIGPFKHCYPSRADGSELLGFILPAPWPQLVSGAAGHQDAVKSFIYHIVSLISVSV